ncbi:MAG: DUF2147 domain-containing protein [Rhodobacteraceae bacterium]|nr:DUF2147 domain-containing protein [Paracoccaceae bacterium]
MRKPAPRPAHYTIRHGAGTPDPFLCDGPLIGVPVLCGFSPKPGGWRDGKLYNPDDGKTFIAHLVPVSPDQLRVTGCLGPLCRSQLWKREAR